jgi:glutamate racemase
MPKSLIMIGLFDSGSGGLSVLTALKKHAPNVDVCYFGDIAHAPYGIRSASELIELTRAGVSVLKKMGATEIVSACNSISPAILAGAASNMPVIEMTIPTARGMQAHRGKKVLLIATSATVASGIYMNALRDIVSLDQLPIPELAGAIEFGSSDAEIAQIVRDAFTSRKGHAYDCLLLGCTHYPLVQKIIEQEAQRIFGAILCIDPAEFVASEVVNTFHTEGMGTLFFAISKDSDTFRDRVAHLFADGTYTVEVI